MSPGPLPYQAIDEAIAIGQLRGRVQMNGTLHERLYDITIATSVPVALVSVKTAPRILAPAREIAAEFNEDILRFRTMIRDKAVSCELWLRSRQAEKTPETMSPSQIFYRAKNTICETKWKRYSLS